MTSLIQASYSDEQISAWLRGLLTIAWADGDFAPEEKAAIVAATQDELAPGIDLGELEAISPEELAAHLGSDAHAAENFLRTAVMVAISDGIYSATEAHLLAGFSKALDLDVEALRALEHTLYEESDEAIEPTTAEATGLTPPAKAKGPDLLAPVRHWLDDYDVQEPRLARFICKLVPAQCPFERDVKLFGRKIVHIPPLCKLNPLYEQLVGLRFRSLSYLADDCKEDVTPYI